MSVDQVARELKVIGSQIRALIETGDLRAIQMEGGVTLTVNQGGAVCYSDDAGGASRGAYGFARFLRVGGSSTGDQTAIVYASD